MKLVFTTDRNQTTRNFSTLDSGLRDETPFVGQLLPCIREHFSTLNSGLRDETDGVPESPDEIVHFSTLDSGLRDETPCPTRLRRRASAISVPSTRVYAMKPRDRFRVPRGYPRFQYPRLGSTR